MLRITALVLLLPLTSLAQEYDLKSRPSAKVVRPDSARAKKAQGASGRRAAPRQKRRGGVAKYGVGIAAKNPIRWGGDISYGVRTDLADQVKPRVYSHMLSLGYGFQYMPSKVSVSALLQVAYESTGERRSEILVDSDRAELFVNDFGLAVAKDLSAAWDSSVRLTLANEFPTSPEAKLEDYASVTWVSAGWRIPLAAKKVTLGLKSEIYYIWNSYEYSPATGMLNKRGAWRNEASASWNFWKGWFVGGAVGSQLAQYLDGSGDVTYRNAATTGYAWERFSLSASFSNGTYLDREDAGIWFVDEYRRVVSLGARYGF